jgi:hypothetical protein
MTLRYLLLVAIFLILVALSAAISLWTILEWWGL